MSESVMGACGLKNFIEIYNENETKLTKIPYSFLSVLESVKIARLAIQQKPINKVIKQSKRKTEKQISLF